MRPAIAAFVLLASASTAAAAPLTSTVGRMDPEPTVVVTPAASGATPELRYRAGRHRQLPAGAPLVLLVRLPPASSADVVTVVAAERTGRRIRVKLETRRFTGPLAANVVTTPLIEIVLGALPAGRHEVRIDETVLEFDRYGAPQTARNPRRGLGTTLSFEVR